MVLINGRMSHRSFPRWRRVSGTISALLSRFDVCLAQSRVDAERFAMLGARNVAVTGNLKLDVPAPPADFAKLERLMSVTRGRPIIVAASTHPGEEEILLEAHRALAGLFPVAPDRRSCHGTPAAARRSRERSKPRGLHASLRSRDELPIAATDIYVADTMGELGLFYRLSPIVFMGGSLIEHGGQNPIEAIKLGASVVHGPHVFNFGDVYEALDGAGGARLAETHEALVKQLGQLLADPGRAHPRARRCRARGLATGWRARPDARGTRALYLAVASRDGGGGCMSRPFGTGHHRGCRCCCRRSPQSMVRSPASRLAAQGP